MNAQGMDFFLRKALQDRAMNTRELGLNSNGMTEGVGRGEML
jgi:hypothetical protein